MEDSKLKNYSIAEYGSKADMDLSLYRSKEKRDTLMPMLKAKGLLRFSILRIWNKQGIFRLGYLFEYKDEVVYKSCQEIRMKEESDVKANSPVKFLQTVGQFLKTTIKAYFFGGKK